MKIPYEIINKTKVNYSNKEDTNNKINNKANKTINNNNNIENRRVNDNTIINKNYIQHNWNKIINTFNITIHLN